MHGLIFETSVCYWQNQPGCYLYYFVVKGNTGAAKKGKMPFPHAGVFSPVKRFASTNANTEGLLSDWPSLGCLSMGTPTYSISAKNTFLA